MADPKSKLTPSDTFRGAFVGKVVKLLCSTDDSNQKEGVLIVIGYLLDWDDTYFYIGETLFEAEVAVKRSIVNLVELHKEKNDELEILENMPIPVDDEGKN